MIYHFNELPPQHSTLAGGKGRVLAQLTQSRYTVPDGFIILPSAFEGNALTPAAWTQAQALLSALRSRNCQTAFAVRSSALSEDSAQASFAGEFETVLDVKSAVNCHRQNMLRPTDIVARMSLRFHYLAPLKIRPGLSDT
jgi:rifampicin phosphotransferase